MLKFCTAWPAPPFIKLSIADKIIILFLNLVLHTRYMTIICINYIIGTYQ